MQTIIKDIDIRAISSWLPEKCIEVRSFGERYGESAVENIIKATGVERIREAEPDMCSSDMCAKAAEYLIEQLHIDPCSIDGLVFVSQTTDWILPATSISLQDRLGLSKETVCLDIHYGCSGYVYGIFQAALWICSGACENVLVLAGDTTTRMINPDDKSLRLIFGDCGTATLVSRGGREIGFNIMSDGSGSDRLIVPAGGFRLPCSQSTAVVKCDEDNNCRSQNDLYMDGTAIFNFAITKVHRNINTLLEQMKWDDRSKVLFAIHQANAFMVNYIRKKLKVEPEQVPVDCRDFGNTGPSTIPLLLSDIYSDSNVRSLHKTVMSGFGVGLSIASMATDLSETQFLKPINR